MEAGREGSAEERTDARASLALRSSANFNRFCSISAVSSRQRDIQLCDDVTGRERHKTIPFLRSTVASVEYCQFFVEVGN